MGHLHSSVTSSDRDFRQRSRRKTTASGQVNVESAPSVKVDQATVEGKKALYHCNYCNRDISVKIHIKCAQCTEFDLCVECFSVGAEVTPHKSNHPYRVMSVSFPLLCPEWNADEEILLLEGFEMYGVGDWGKIAEHVSTKNKAQCIDHYTNAYLNSPNFPLPDMSHVAGENRVELLSSAKEHCEDSKDGFDVSDEEWDDKYNTNFVLFGLSSGNRGYVLYDIVRGKPVVPTGHVITGHGGSSVIEEFDSMFRKEMSMFSAIRECVDAVEQAIKNDHTCGGEINLIMGSELQWVILDKVTKAKSEEIE